MAVWWSGMVEEHLFLWNRVSSGLQKAGGHLGVRRGGGCVHSLGGGCVTLGVVAVGTAAGQDTTHHQITGVTKQKSENGGYSSSRELVKVALTLPSQCPVSLLCIRDDG